MPNMRGASSPPCTLCTLSSTDHPYLHSFPTRRSSDLYPTTKIRVNATCRKCPHKVHRMEMKTAISCTILRHTKRSEERFSRNAETEIVCRLLLEKKKRPPVKPIRVTGWACLSRGKVRSPS